MSNITYIQNEAKKGFKGWTKEGWDFLLHDEHYKKIAIDSLSKILQQYQKVEFVYNNLDYEIFTSSKSSYVVNIYSSDEKILHEQYLEQNNIDGKLFAGSAKDTIALILQQIKKGVLCYESKSSTRDRG